MKASSLREHTDDELREMCDEKTKALSDLNVKSVIGEAVEQPLQIRYTRRDIARIKTVLNDRARQQEVKRN